MICGFSACVKNLFDERLLTHLGLTRCKPLHFKVKCACHVTCNYPDTEGRDGKVCAQSPKESESEALIRLQRSGVRSCR